jgi:hypothetical protein
MIAGGFAFVDYDHAIAQSNDGKACLRFAA